MVLLQAYDALLLIDKEWLCIAWRRLWYEVGVDVENYVLHLGAWVCELARIGRNFLFY